MWWIRDLVVTKGTDRDSAVELEATLTLGTIERVFVLGRPGCSAWVKVTLWRHEHQILPEEAGGYVLANKVPWDQPFHYELDQVPASVLVRAWNTASTYDHTVLVGIYVREKAERSAADLLRELFGLGGGD